VFSSAYKRQALRIEIELCPFQCRYLLTIWREPDVLAAVLCILNQFFLFKNSQFHHHHHHHYHQRHHLLAQSITVTMSNTAKRQYRAGQ